MDSREPSRQPQPQPPPSSMVGPTSYASVPNTSPLISPNSTMMAPATARFPFASQPPPPPPSSSILSEPFNSAAASSTTTASPYDGSASPAALKPCGAEKKKRGRPRKYSPDGGNIALGLAPTHVPSSAAAAAGGGGDSSGTLSTDAPSKKHRGRPPGSGKKQLDALGAGGVGFTPHVILVESGEDIAEKIMAFSQQGPRTVCILSANGSIRNVTLRQPALSGGIATYEGRFEIISLSGSLMLSEKNRERSRTCSLSVSVAGSDGRVLGGGVAGTLTAASPVQIIVGSFIANGKKSSSNTLKSGPSSAPTSQMLTFGSPMTPTSPTSQGPSTESSEDNDHSPFNKGAGLYDNNASQPVNNNNNNMQQMYHHPLWAGHAHQ